MTARELALEILLESESGKEFAWERLNARLQYARLEAADRGLATELVYGSIRRRGSLDALIEAQTGQRPIQPVIREVLRLGAYQLAYLDSIPSHAALNEAVELAKRRGHSRAAGFVNGVLRNLDRLLTTEYADSPAADALPIAEGRYRRLLRPIFPDPQQSPSHYFAASFSMPQWLADRWLRRFGWAELMRLGFWFALPAPLWIRVNTTRTSRESLRDLLAAAGHSSEPGPHPQSLRLLEHAPIRTLPGFDQGLFTVQDHSSMTVATALAPAPGATTLDCCAAPGGKATHLAELMNNQGRIVACDVDENRLMTVNELSRRLGVSIVETRLMPRDKAPGLRVGPAQARAAGMLPGAVGGFDAALVDVPCSNTGVLGRRPEVRWRLTPGDFNELVPMQLRLLLDACAQVRPGGVAVYSTCSIEPEENGEVVRAALAQAKDWTLDEEREHRPGQPSDGGYWARMRRSG